MLLNKLHTYQIVFTVFLPFIGILFLIVYMHANHIPSLQVSYMDKKSILNKSVDQPFRDGLSSSDSDITKNTVSAVSSITRAPVLSQQKAVECVSCGSSAVVKENDRPIKGLVSKKKSASTPKKRFATKEVVKQKTRSVKQVTSTDQPVQERSSNPSVVLGTSLWIQPFSIKCTNSFQKNRYDQYFPFKANKLFKKEKTLSTSYDTLLHSAAACGDKATVWEMLYNGMDVDVVSSHGYTPLHLAVQHGHLPIIQLLLIKGASLHARSKEGHSILDLAISLDQSAIIDYLLTHYSNKVFGYHDKGYSILHVASRYDAKNTIELLLLSQQFSVDKRGIIGQTPLHIAAKYGKLQALKMLLFFNADINAQAKDGYTPLHLAIQCDQRSIAEALLSKGAHLHIATDKKETPLLLAKRLGRKEMIALLTQRSHA